VEPYFDRVDALVAAWLPGSEGQGVTDTIFMDSATNLTVQAMQSLVWYSISYFYLSTEVLNLYDNVPYLPLLRKEKTLVRPEMPGWMQVYL
jgi:hypothetical protein